MKYFKFLIILLAAALFINCDNKDDKAWLWGLAWLSQSSTIAETATVEVTGTAKDGDGNVISNGTVSISETTTSSNIQARASLTSSTTTDDSGNFTLYLKVAKFTITVKKSDGTEVGSFELDIQNTTEQHVQATNVTGLTISLTSAKPVNGDTDLLAVGNSSTTSCSGSSIIRDWGCFTDMNDGTIKLEVNAGTYGGNTYTAKTLYFAKCTHGQSWNSSSNDCTGTGSSGDNYGATTAQYCDVADNSCNGGTNDGVLNGSGTSGAYSACSGLSLASKTWRVPTKNELKLLIECTDQTMTNDDNTSCGSGNYTSPAVNDLFPNTVSLEYRSSSGYSTSSGGAWFVNFWDGRAWVSSKTNNFYLRCVSE